MAVEGRRGTDHRSEIVTAAGAATTLLALAAVFALAHDGTERHGLVRELRHSGGALLVGALAASGYGIAAWFTGLKMTRRLILSVIGQLVLSYFIAQYEEYRHAVPGGEIGFFAWFDLGHPRVLVRQARRHAGRSVRHVGLRDARARDRGASSQAARSYPPR